MEHFRISHTEAGFHIEGFPDAVKAIHITGPVSRRLADLWLHKADLEFAADCINEINRVPDIQRIVREALWRSAIVHYAKCFGNSKVRFQLSSAKIYRDIPLGLATHSYFIDLRDKHVVHDENAYAQSFPGAVLNRGDKAYKIEKIVCVATFIQTLNQELWNNLKVLIDKALEWVVTEFDSICDLLTRELEQEPYSALLARESISMRLPAYDEVAKNRRVP